MLTEQALTEQALTEPVLTDYDRTPEALTAQIDDYAVLSARYAARGDARRAALAVWAADLRTVQSLLWEGGLAAADDPAQQLLAVASAVETALTSREPTADPSVRRVVEDARRALSAVFDESVHHLLVARFVALDHLDGTPAPTSGEANQVVQDRLAGRTGEQLVSDLLTASTDSRTVARVLAEVGDDDEARRQSAAADLAGFEAYLVMASAASGDATLATAELRWDLAAMRSGRSGIGSDDVRLGPAPRPPLAVRDAMCAVVVPAEEDALLSVLDRAAPLRAAG